MEVYRTESFEADFAGLPITIQKRFASKLTLFINNPFHPSLHTKKMQGTVSIWELRVSKNYRCTFLLNKNICIFRRIGTHDTLRMP